MNETITPELKLYSKRVDCIIEKIEKNNLARTVNESNYDYEPNGAGWSLTILDRDRFERDIRESIESANFSCTIIGYCAIALIVIVLVGIVSCVSCLSKRK